MKPSFLAFLFPVMMSPAGLGVTGGSTGDNIGDRSTSELERRLELIDLEIGKLAQPSLNSGVGPIGYRSRDYPDSAHSEWVEVALGTEAPVDAIVLVPALWRSTEEGFTSDGFPAAFRVSVGVSDDSKGTVVAELADASALLPRTAPVVIPVNGRQATWVRVEATRLSPRAFDGRYILQLSELLVFHGEQNRALHRPVRDSSNIGGLPAWNVDCLVDGILPYVMNAAEGEQSLAFVSSLGIGPTPAMTIDLGDRSRISGIRLHATDQSDTVPQAFGGEFGLPRRFQVMVADRKDLSDERSVLDVTLRSIYETGPIMEWSFPETSGRRVRLQVLDPYVYEDFTLSGTQVGFAEIEILDRGLNVALGKPVQASFGVDNPNRSLGALTDGRNLYGNILPVRQWLNQLARRHDLETERPLLAAELAIRYARQKTNLTRMFWLAAGLVALIACVIVYYRFRGMRKEAQIRERIAANLHDNLGANLHAIGLLGDLARDSVDSREELIDTVKRIRALTERTGSAARSCANMLATSGTCDDLLEEMRRDSESLLADLEKLFLAEGETSLQQLPRRKRIDLYLFYKEALVNVIRHSGATRVETRVVGRPGEVLLTVTDNGQGFEGDTPSSLKRRARLLGAECRAEHPAEGGTRIVMRLKLRKLSRLR